MRLNAIGRTKFLSGIEILQHAPVPHIVSAQMTIERSGKYHP